MSEQREWNDTHRLAPRGDVWIPWVSSGGCVVGTDVWVWLKRTWGHSEHVIDGHEHKLVVVTIMHVEERHGRILQVLFRRAGGMNNKFKHFW